jgi:hypothetical protein
MTSNCWWTKDQLGFTGEKILDQISHRWQVSSTNVLHDDAKRKKQKPFDQKETEKKLTYEFGWSPTFIVATSNLPVADDRFEKVKNE